MICRIEDLLKHSVAELYPNFVAHAQSIDESRFKWARVYRTYLPIRGQNTNNFVKASMRMFKDKIFQRMRAFNIVQMTDFLFFGSLRSLLKFFKFPERKSELLELVSVGY